MSSASTEVREPPKGGIKVFHDVREFKEAFRRRSDRISPRDRTFLGAEAASEQQEGAQAVTVVSSLQRLCEVKLERAVTLSTVIPLLHYTSENPHLFPPGSRLKEKCETFVANTFSALCKAEGAEAVRAAIPDRFEALEAESIAWDLKQRRWGHKGRVIDKEGPSQHQENEQPGGATYPLESLQAGVEWPSNVDPARREVYLSNADFARAFGMARAEFELLPMWKRQRLKQSAGLF